MWMMLFPLSCKKGLIIGGSQFLYFLGNCHLWRPDSVTSDEVHHQISCYEATYLVVHSNQFKQIFHAIYIRYLRIFIKGVNNIPMFQSIKSPQWFVEVQAKDHQLQSFLLNSCLKLRKIRNCAWHQHQFDYVLSFLCLCGISYSSYFITCVEASIKLVIGKFVWRTHEDRYLALYKALCSTTESKSWKIHLPPGSFLSSHIMGPLCPCEGCTYLQTSIDYFLLLMQSIPMSDISVAESFICRWLTYFDVLDIIATEVKNLNLIYPVC